jgi:hypothetical protein
VANDGVFHTHWPATGPRSSPRHPRRTEFSRFPAPVRSSGLAPSSSGSPSGAGPACSRPSEPGRARLVTHGQCAIVEAWTSPRRSRTRRE